jgi:general stress protein 26
MEEDFSTYIGTNTSSRKTSQIRADSRVCLYYSDSRFYRGLSVMGLLEEVTDRDVHRALWRRGWESYYPGGPEDPDFSVFRFRADKARYYHGLAVLELDCAKGEAADGSEGR